MYSGSESRSESDSESGEDFRKRYRCNSVESNCDTNTDSEMDWSDIDSELITFAPEMHIGCVREFREYMYNYNDPETDWKSSELPESRESPNLELFGISSNDSDDYHTDDNNGYTSSSENSSSENDSADEESPIYIPLDDESARLFQMDMEVDEPVDENGTQNQNQNQNQNQSEESGKRICCLDFNSEDNQKLVILNDVLLSQATNRDDDEMDIVLDDDDFATYTLVNNNIEWMDEHVRDIGPLLDDNFIILDGGLWQRSSD